MTNAITKAAIRSTRGSAVLPPGISYAWFAWERCPATPPACRCIEFHRRRSASVSSRRRPFRAYALWECSRCVQPRAAAAAAPRDVRATACSRIIAGTTRRWIVRHPSGTLRSPSPFLSRSDVRSDRFHGWSAPVHHVPPSRTERIARLAVISVARGAEGESV